MRNVLRYPWNLHMHRSYETRHLMGRRLGYGACMACSACQLCIRQREDEALTRRTKCVFSLALWVRSIMHIRRKQHRSSHARERFHSDLDVVQVCTVSRAITNFNGSKYSSEYNSKIHSRLSYCYSSSRPFPTIARFYCLSSS